MLVADDKGMVIHTFSMTVLRLQWVDRAPPTLIAAELTNVDMKKDNLYLIAVQRHTKFDNPPLKNYSNHHSMC